jgi:hypothetical protein
MVCRIADKFRTPETETARSCSTRERQHIGRGDGVYCRQAIARREVDNWSPLSLTSLASKSDRFWLRSADRPQLQSDTGC